jgi:hypothetical protein
VGAVASRFRLIAVLEEFPTASVLVTLIALLPLPAVKLMDCE